MMPACGNCGSVIKHVGDGVWIDNMQGECCRLTEKTHYPQEKSDVLSGDT
jgi:hypothetical protein